MSKQKKTEPAAPFADLESKGQNSLLAISLSCAVPLRVWGMKTNGGPSTDEWDRARSYGQVLAEKGDILLFGKSKQDGEVADLFNRLAEAIAVLAFLPGGVRVFGQTWDAEQINFGKKGT